MPNKTVGDWEVAVSSRVQSRMTRQTRKTASVKLYFVESECWPCLLESWRWAPNMSLCRMVEVATGGRSYVKERKVSCQMIMRLFP